MQKNLSTLIKRIKSWIQENKVIDVVLFGSTLRGKHQPNDLDLCILIDDHDEKRSLDLVHSLGQLADSPTLKSQINILTLGALFKGESLAKTLFFEGISIKGNKPLASLLGLSSKSLFIYNLKNFDATKRVRFHYLLKGRHGTKGILSETQGMIIGTGSILVPASKEDILKEVFDQWHVHYRIERLLVS